MPPYRMFGESDSVVSIPKLVITQVFQFSIHMKPSDGMSGIS